MATYNVSLTLAANAAYAVTDRENRQFTLTVSKISNGVEVKVVRVEAS